MRNLNTDNAVSVDAFQGPHQVRQSIPATVEDERITNRLHDGIDLGGATDHIGFGGLTNHLLDELLLQLLPPVVATVDVITLPDQFESIVFVVVRAALGEHEV